MDYLAKFQSFTNVEELNEAVLAHVSRCKHELTNTNIAVLNELNQHAVEYSGAAHVTMLIIADSINKSRKTVQRSVRKLEQLKIIKTRPVARESGAQDANIYIFLEH